MHDDAPNCVPCPTRSQQHQGCEGLLYR
jgi:hypothetical protein